MGTLGAGRGIIPPFSQLSDFGSSGQPCDSDKRCTTTTMMLLLDRTGTCWHLLLGLGGLGLARAGVGRGDNASHGGWVGESVVSLVSASGDGRLVLPWPSLVGLLTPSPDHPERIEWRGVLPYSTPSLRSWLA